jgi:hypothetical protein
MDQPQQHRAPGAPSILARCPCAGPRRAGPRRDAGADDDAALRALGHVLNGRMLGRGKPNEFTCGPRCCDWSRPKGAQRALEDRQWRREWAADEEVEREERATRQWIRWWCGQVDWSPDETLSTYGL